MTETKTDKGASPNHVGHGRELSAQDFERAAYLRFCEGLNWDRVAREIGCVRQTFWYNRNNPLWLTAAAKAIEEIRSIGGAEAYGCLLRQAHNGDTVAAGKLLDRIEGAVTQKNVVTDADGNNPNQPIADGLRDIASAILAERRGVLPQS